MPPLARRTLVPGVLLAGFAARPAEAREPAGPRADWDALRSRFLGPEGQMRVTGRPAVTDAFLQATALLAAQRAEDREGFSRVLAWSRTALARPEDRLWVWRHEAPTQRAPIDINNTTQADVLAAWALCAAGQLWPRSDFRRLGQAMAQDVLQRCVMAPPGPVLLLPAAGGFANATRAVLAPGAVPLAALTALEREVPDPRWAALRAETLSLLRRARFGSWRLPADWVEVDRPSGRVSLATGWPTRFATLGAGALLHLCWAGLGGEPLVASVLGFWQSGGPVPLPAWADLSTGAVAPHRAGPGVAAIAALAEAAQLGRGTMEAMPRVTQAEDEETATQILLVRMAWRDLGFSRRGE